MDRDFERTQISNGRNSRWKQQKTKGNLVLEMPCCSQLIGRDWLGRAVAADQKTPSTAFSESTLTSDTWAHGLNRNKIRCGTRRTMLDSYFSEFMWRRRLQPGEDVFENILHEIAAYWPPDYVIGSFPFCDAPPDEWNQLSGKNATNLCLPESSTFRLTHLDAYSVVQPDSY
ncbi:hypothetical protein M513_09976 [Trichuris suis]|uniref:Uncharacterized protein n=1 Tax=Trichuris suis TaxID=68888 RepID=A0A085LW06_9BILA|nr:hypothetical protein M513_09976 [Trichuris suis]